MDIVVGRMFETGRFLQFFKPTLVGHLDGSIFNGSSFLFVTSHREGDIQRCPENTQLLVECTKMFIASLYGP